MTSPAQGIYVISESIHIGTYWHAQILDAIFAGAKRHKIQLFPISTDQIDRIPLDCSPVILIGVTGKWIMGVQTQLSQRGLTCLAVGTDSMDLNEGVSVISANQARMAEIAVSYFASANRRKLAFVGHNPFSHNDQSKLAQFQQACQRLSIPFDADDVFLFNGNMKQCIDAFARKSAQYDGALCTNDVVGVSILRNETLHARIPNELFVISYGHTMISQLVSPTLSTISFNYDQVGTIAVNTVLYLRRNPDICSQHILINEYLHVGGSTAFTPMPAVQPQQTRSPIAPLPVYEYAGFYQDETTEAVLGLQAFLNSLDKLDFAIVLHCLRKTQKTDVLNALFISESTYKYRLRRICTQTGVVSRQELYDYLIEWVSPQLMEAYYQEHYEQHTSSRCPR